MKQKAGILVASLVLIAGCSQPPSDTSTPTSTSRGNPLLAEWDTPFGVPPFDQIQAEDYLPALRESMARHTAEIEAITGDPEPPTFANTIEALERSGGMLERVNNVFSAVNGAHSNETTRAAATEIAPELSAHGDDVSLNAALFARVNAVYEQIDQLGLDAEQMRLLTETHKDFVRAGATLDEAAQTRLREINGELATLSEEFRNNLLEETNTFELLVTDRADLGALPSSLAAAAAEEATRRGHECECWVFTLSRPSINPFLEYSPNRELRRQMFEG